MGRSKLKLARSILYLLVSLLLMVAGVGPIIYIIYFVLDAPTGPSDAPTGPSEPVTTGEFFMYTCILIALGLTTGVAAHKAAQAIGRLIKGEKKGVGIDNGE
jgi:hypothetical protein